MSEEVTNSSFESLHQRVSYLEEKVGAQQQMLEMTSDYLLKIQKQLEESKVKLELANKNVMDSIHYAERIQNALIPDASKLDMLFQDSFIFFKPKDYVSGDFYWLYNTPKVKYAAAVDCTGHGVPGAMLTVLANSLLNQIVKAALDLSPRDILIQLDILIHHYFNTESNQIRIRDGLDISLISYKPESKDLTICTTHQPAYLFLNDDLIEVKGAKYSIGENSNRKGNLKESSYNISRGDRVYLSSDGFMDQFGGNTDSKFKKKPFRELLVEIQKLPMDIQPKRLESEFESWKGDKAQTDDILIIGINL